MVRGQESWKREIHQKCILTRPHRCTPPDALQVLSKGRSPGSRIVVVTNCLPRRYSQWLCACTTYRLQLRGQLRHCINYTHRIPILASPLSQCCTFWQW